MLSVVLYQAVKHAARTKAAGSNGRQVLQRCLLRVHAGCVHARKANAGVCCKGDNRIVLGTEVPIRQLVQLSRIAEQWRFTGPQAWEHLQHEFTFGSILVALKRSTKLHVEDEDGLGSLGQGVCDQDR